MVKSAAGDSPTTRWDVQIGMYLFLGTILAAAHMVMDGSYENWRAAQLQHEHNNRGLIKCNGGRINVNNFDVDGVSLFDLMTKLGELCKEQTP